MPAEERIYYLLDKYAGDSATEAELDELNSLLNDPAFDQLAQDYLAGLLRATAPVEMDNEERLQTVLRIARGGRRITIRRFWWAAAAVFIGTALSLWVVIRKTEPQPVVADRQTLQHDRAPGGNVAVLTLADGKSITLDSAREGMLAEQGNASVTKTGNGMLAYRPTTGTPADGATTPTLFNRLTTPRGGQYRLLLPDGTQVWLNAASSIVYPTAFTDSVRTVTITGEAYFEIARNASMPFTVRVDAPGGRKEIRVLGTHFNVKAYSDEKVVTTTLLEGSVRLVDAGARANAAAATGPNTAAGPNAVTGPNAAAGPNTATGIILKPGEQGEWRVDGSMQLNPHANIEEAVAWKNGMFHFEQADLPEIMRQIARWYDVDVVFQGKPPATRFNGEIPRNSNLTEVFKILQLSNVRFTVEDKKVIVEQ